jgi:hypothetical protein
LLHTHVGVPAITAERCLDSGAIDVRFGLVVCDVRNDAEVDVSDIGVGTDHDAVEVLLELAVVHRHVFVDGATPEATPNPGSSGKVGACDARWLKRAALEEDGEGIAGRGLVTKVGAYSGGSAQIHDSRISDAAENNVRLGSSNVDHDYGNPLTSLNVVVIHFNVLNEEPWVVVGRVKVLMWLNIVVRYNSGQSILAEYWIFQEPFGGIIGWHRTGANRLRLAVTVIEALGCAHGRRCQRYRFENGRHLEIEFWRGPRRKNRKVRSGRSFYEKHS